MGTAAADLEARQLRILGRIADLELAAQQRRLGALSISAAPSEGGEADAGTTEARLSALLAARGVRDFAFRRVPADYYDRPLEERQGLLRADSVAQLCKSIVMVRFSYVDVALRQAIVRLAPEEESHKLTGFVHNGVTCIGMETNIPVIVDEAITKLDEDFFWLGGGEVDLKLGMRTSQFLSAFSPFVVKCS
ncbi:unnamed protein product [Urochloa decumbens]|uniref:YbaK/aminoacyl-tRNA synthetase-associated domain-containing protein n=1 Tax=Urochloa decumbens TaxID=240449 RepID=A0ABC8V933_9POAL